MDMPAETEQYWVVGAEYTDTTFRQAVGDEQRHGPFASHDEARVKWAGLSWAAVDDAHIRDRIEKTGSVRFWVVGGVYTDTRLSDIAGGATEERLGPFDSYDDAVAAWRAKAWATVDDVCARFRIERM